MTAVEAKSVDAPIAGRGNRDTYWRLAKAAICVAVPLIIWLALLSLDRKMQAAFAIAAFMILAWMTELMEYASAGLLGLLLFWFFGVAQPEVIFSGFVNDAAWFYLGAVLIGAMAAKSGLPQRIANFVITRIGATYSRLLLGLLIIDYLLTIVVPSGAAVLVIMASIALGVMKLFGAEKGSNIGRGLFLVLTYTTGLFNKMMISGSASIMSRGIIERTGGSDVSWGLWLAAFLPCSIITILAAWWFTLKNLSARSGKPARPQRRPESPFPHRRAVDAHGGEGERAHRSRFRVVDDRLHPPCVRIDRGPCLRPVRAAALCRCARRQGLQEDQPAAVLFRRLRARHGRSAEDDRRVEHIDSGVHCRP